jgi:metal-dependent HD superfamily phosphatase/phosphodiesterase
MKSPLEIHLEQELFNMLDGAALDIARILCNDEEIHTYQELANTVSIKRLGFNDHGPVHMRKVAINAMRMFNLLMEAGIRPSLVNEDIGTETDSRIAVLLAAFLHDIGMSIGRQSHEMSSFILANPLMERVLKCIFPDEAARWIAIKTVALEGIMGHMTHHAIHTLEAGIILICGRLRHGKGTRAHFRLLLNQQSRGGDINKYSSASVERVTIEKGGEKPLKITVEMSASVGFFQVEEVLISKIMASTVKKHIELYAFVSGRDVKRYI